MALELADAVAEQFADAAWLVDPALLADPTHLVQAVAEALRLRGDGTRATRHDHGEGSLDQRPRAVTRGGHDAWDTASASPPRGPCTGVASRPYGLTVR